MSDIPELDRLIEESENIRRNQNWRRQDRFFKLSMLFIIFSFLSFILTIPVFGPEVAAVILVVFFIGCLMPLLYMAFRDVFFELLKDDWEGRDMTKRYMRK